MIRHAWRIVKARHATTAFTGDGARTHGGRWNSPGTPIVYLAGSTSLAMLELLVHLQSHELLRKYVLFEVTFDDDLLSTLDPASLPKSWRRSPPPAAVQHIGDAWVAAAATPVLRVPSVVVPTEYNYLLNPLHPQFHKITRGPKQPVKFDPRLLKLPEP